MTNPVQSLHRSNSTRFGSTVFVVLGLHETALRSWSSTSLQFTTSRTSIARISTSFPSKIRWISRFSAVQLVPGMSSGVNVHCPLQTPSRRRSIMIPIPRISLCRPLQKEIYVFITFRTDNTTSLGKDRFSAYHLTYTFPSAHRLQTLTSTLRFNRPNGTQLDCGVVKITPDLGKPVSAALTYTPIGVLFLTAISSWRTHLSSLDYSSILEHGSVFAGQGPLWAVILELTSYLRHLQFVFISASMSIEYPGFYVPAVSKIAWSCLLFWRGPVDHGYSHPGIDGGMCVSNASYGMQFMPQMLGYPNAINTLFNSLINLAVLVVPAFLLLALFVLKMRQPTQVETLGFRPIAKLTAGISAGITLCFFSVPLLSYMAYDLILVGYLPSYRIALAVAMLLILIGAHSFLTRQVDSELRYKPLSDLPGHEREGNYYHRLWRATNVQLPHLVPLLQAIAVGSLQDYPLAQVSILATTELMIPIQMAYTGNFTTTTTLFSVVRTISILLCAVLVSAISESTRQRVGYAMLALHGLVVLPGWVIRSGWYLYRSFQSEQDLPQTAFPTRNDGSSDLSPVSLSKLMTLQAH